MHLWSDADSRIICGSNVILERLKQTKEMSPIRKGIRQCRVSNNNKTESWIKPDAAIAQALKYAEGLGFFVCLFACLLACFRIGALHKSFA